MKNMIGLVSPILFIVGVFFVLSNPTDISIIIIGMIAIAISMLSLSYSIIFREQKTIKIARKKSPKKKK